MCILLFLLLLLLVTGLTACSSTTSNTGSFAEPADLLTLEAGETAGQTFVARQSGLNAVRIFLQPQQAGRGTLLLHLHDSPPPFTTTTLATAHLPLDSVTHPGFYRFAFAPQANSQQRDYYLALEVEGSGQVQAGTAPGHTYLNGALYHNQEPRDAQMMFDLAFDPLLHTLGLLRQGLAWAGIGAVSIVLYLLPGWALLLLLWPTDSHPLLWSETVGLAAGLSLVCYPLLVLWSHLAGWHLGAWYAWLPPLVAVAIIVWHHRHWHPADLRIAWADWRYSDARWPDIALLVVVALVFGVRLLVIHPLDVPLWVDSYHHTLIAQLLVDNGGLFQSWQPYANLETFTYHFGMHTLVAAFHWASGLSMPQAMLWVGQVLNGLSIIALYPLVLRASRNRWAAVGTLLVAGLIAPMPMFYINWGRYTQLAGQAVLPVVVYLVWTAVQSPSRNWRLLLLACLALGGLSLIHYRVLIFALMFFPALFLLELRRDTVIPLTARLMLIGLGAGIIFLPQFIQVFAGKIMHYFTATVVATTGQTPNFAVQLNTIGNLSSYLPPPLWLAFALSIAWGLWRRERSVALISLWWLFALLIVNPNWVHLPGAGTLTNFALFLAAYIPASIMVGFAIGWLLDIVQRLTGPVVCLVLIFAAAGWGMFQQADTVQVSTFALALRPDVRAATWVSDHTPPEARFLVNAFIPPNGSVYAGSDGGCWLPLLARRQTTLPPYIYGIEEGGGPAYREQVNTFYAAIREHGVEHPDVQAMLRERGVTHIYIGQQKQPAMTTLPPLLQPEPLLKSDHARLVYHQDRVWVFELVQETHQ